MLVWMDWVTLLLLKACGVAWMIGLTAHELRRAVKRLKGEL